MALTLLILYFVGILMLNSYANLVRQTSTWSLQLAQQARGITENWLRSSMILLGLVMVVALLIPGFQLPDARGLIDLLIRIIIYAWQVLLIPLAAILWLVAKLASLFYVGGDTPNADRPPPAPPPMTTSGSGSLLEFLQAAALWAVLAVTAYLIFRRLTRDRPQFKPLQLLAYLGRMLMALGTAILETLVGFFALTTQAVRLAGLEVAGRLMGARPGARAGGGRAGRSRRLSNRERVWSIYLEFLADAEVHGLRRNLNQTPFEFERRMETRLTLVRESLGALTRAFVHARYTSLEVDDELVRAALRERQALAAGLRAPE